MRSTIVLIYLLLGGMSSMIIAQRPVVDQVAQEFHALFSSKFKAGEPGGSILIKKGDNNIYLGNFGVADLISGEKVTENTVFNTGSISKTFVANGILILAERGRISLDDPLSKYFEDFEHPGILENIKIKHLLSHTSGLPDNRNVSANEEFFMTARDIENFRPLKSATKLDFEPGTQFKYSNPCYNGLALIIEEVTGKKWQRFIKEEIFEPAGMLQSEITDGPHPETGVAHAYNNENGNFIENDYGEFATFAAAGNGGIWSTVLELAKYEEALRKNVFLRSKLTDESRDIFNPPTWSSTTDPFVGYAWFIGEKSLLGNRSDFDVDIVYHTGSQGGFRAFYISIPEKDLIYIALFNRPVDGFRDLMKEGLEILRKGEWLVRS